MNRILIEENEGKIKISNSDKLELFMGLDMVIATIKTFIKDVSEIKEEEIMLYKAIIGELNNELNKLEAYYEKKSIW